MSTDAAGQHEADWAQASWTSDQEDHAEQAARLDRDNPRWLVVWGTFSHEFVAFPLFSVAEGVVLCCRSAPELVRQMRQTEGSYSGSRNAGQ